MFGKKVEERRQHGRIHTYHLVKYKVMSGGAEAQPILASLADIGGGGICLRSQEALQVGALVQVSINLPQFPHPVTSTAKVVWAKKIKNTETFEAGLQFVDIEDAIRNQITGRVEGFAKISGKDGK